MSNNTEQTKPAYYTKFRINDIEYKEWADTLENAYFASEKISQGAEIIGIFNQDNQKLKVEFNVVSRETGEDFSTFDSFEDADSEIDENVAGDSKAYNETEDEARKFYQIEVVFSNEGEKVDSIYL